MKLPSSVTNQQQVIQPLGAHLPFRLPDNDNVEMMNCETIASAKFSGKLKKDSSSLGVTAASWRQSRDMLVHRHQQFSKTADSAYEYLKRNKNALTRLRKEREPLANQILETKFGWQPFVGDLLSAFENITHPIVIPAYLTSRHKQVINTERVANDTVGFKYVERHLGRRWVTYTAEMFVDNPNAWMLNRLGLINPGAAVWDLIPWSFVVAMFVNVNQLISSVTDEVGLQVYNRSITRGRVIRMNGSVYPKSAGYVGGTSSVMYKARQRSLDVKPQVNIMLKVPQLDWNLAVIASSLAVQKISKINKLIRLI